MASLIFAPPAALAAFFAIQENYLLAILDPAADVMSTLTMLYLSYILTFCGLLVIGMPFVLILEKYTGGSLVSAGLCAFVASSAIGTIVTNDLGQLAFLTAGLSSAIFALIYLLPRQPISARND